jgi:flotillin
VNRAEIAGVAVVALLVALVIAFRAMWRVPKPNEALLVTGFGARGGGSGGAQSLVEQELGDTSTAAAQAAIAAERAANESTNFRIVVGKGTFVIPMLQTVSRLDLSARQAILEETCQTKQGVDVQVTGVVVFKVGDDHRSIANAARRFLGSQDQLEPAVQQVFAGHLRSIIGGLTIEEMIRDRARLTQETREASRVETMKLGLIIDSLQIQSIVDLDAGRAGTYIQNLGAPEKARVASEARVAAAIRDREAAQAEAQAQAIVAQAQAESAKLQAAAQAEADKARAEAAAAGPRAQATAQQGVVEQETRVAQLEAARTEQELASTVRARADADAYAQRVGAEATRDAAISQAEARKRATVLEAEAQAAKVTVEATAQADATRLRGTAEAEARRAGRRHPGQGPGRGRRRGGPGPRPGRGPGGHDRAHPRRGDARDDPRGGRAVRQDRPAHRAERRRGPVAGDRRRHVDRRPGAAAPARRGGERRGGRHERAPRGAPHPRGGGRRRSRAAAPLGGTTMTRARALEPSTAGTATAACPAGTQAIGGGFDTAYPYGATRSAPTADGTGWEVQVVNGTMTGWSVRAWVSCL